MSVTDPPWNNKTKITDLTTTCHQTPLRCTLYKIPCVRENHGKNELLYTDLLIWHICHSWVNPAMYEVAWKLVNKWLRNLPCGNSPHISLISHTFLHVSPIVSPVSLGVSHVSPSVSPCFLFSILQPIMWHFWGLF